MVTQDGRPEADGISPSQADDIEFSEADESLLSEADDDIVATRKRRPKRTGKAEGGGLSRPAYTVVVLIVVLVGVAFGSWLANRGRPAATASTTPTAVASPASTSTASVAPQVRILQLEDQITANPNDTDARLELGVLLFQDAQDMEGARQQWLAVTQIDPSNENAWYNLGFYYLSVDPPDCANAQAAWNTVIRLDPEGDNADEIQNHMMGLMPQVCGTDSADATSTTGG